MFRDPENPAQDTAFDRSSSAPGAAESGPEARKIARTRDEAPAANRVLLPTDRPIEGEVLPKKAPRRRRLLVAASALALAIGAGGWYGAHWWSVARFQVSTDDAYVRADTTTLAAKISGYVASVNVADNSQVHAGDVIATIDDGDYRLAVDAAAGKVATQQATVERLAQQIPAQEAAVDQARAQLASAQAAAKRTELELARQQALVAKLAASQQALEQAQANRDQADAAVRSAQAQVDAAAANVDVLKAQQQEARRTLAELRTALEKAQRDLSFAVIRAPVDGVIGNRAVQVGDYVQTGQRLASLVPLNDIYIAANFKETQLARLTPGQPVEVSVDALPGRDITGTVASVAPASGAVFSLLPPDNATGNFTKIVQRLAVRIRVPDDVAAQHLLRPGMSVVVSVDTKPSSAAASTASAAPARTALQ